MIAAAVSFSCQSEIEANGGVNNDDNNDLIENFVPGPGKILAVTPPVDTPQPAAAATKVGYGAANEDGTIPVVWTKNDTIVLYSENCPDGKKYEYELGEKTSAAVFKGEPVEGDTRYAVYPSTRARGLSKDGKLKVSFGALRKQKFRTSLSANAGNLGFYPMWAKETEPNNGQFIFNNLCGSVLFTFNDYQELRGMCIMEVKISSATKHISGLGTIDPATGEFELSYEGAAKFATEKTVIAEETKDGTGLDIANTNKNPSITDAGKSGYVVALPAGTYEAGDLTVTITDNFGRVFSRVITKELVISPGECREFPTLAFTFSYGEANCHVLSPTEGASVTFDAAMRYSFDKSLAVKDMNLVKGINGEDFVGEGYQVKTIWEKAENANEFVAGSVLSSIAYEDNKITVTSAGKRGNALVALYATSGEGETATETILWSWHIWVASPVDDKYEKAVSQGMPTFQDRNLGATTEGFAEQSSVGLYYQYGRKDPFVLKGEFTPSADKDKDYFTSSVELTERELRTTQTARISWAIKNPDRRIIMEVKDESFTAIPPAAFNDWIVPGSEAEKYWGNTAPKANTINDANSAKGGYKTIYDPCPAGYRVPDKFYFQGFGSEVTGKGTSGSGVKFTFKEGETANYPLPGVLNMRGEGVYSYNYHGFYWTSSLTTKRAVSFLYSAETFNATALSNTTAARPAPCNIRCMKIETPAAE